MHMAGPREAIQHMIIRKNYGATHFVMCVHACVRELSLQYLFNILRVGAVIGRFVCVRAHARDHALHACVCVCVCVQWA